MQALSPNQNLSVKEEEVAINRIYNPTNNHSYIVSMFINSLYTIYLIKRLLIYFIVRVTTD